MGQYFVIACAVSGIFMCGVIIGTLFAERNPPNEPKPKNWEDLKFKEWLRGFHDGQKYTKKYLNAQISNELRVNSMLEKYRKTRMEGDQ